MPAGGVQKSDVVGLLLDAGEGTLAIYLNSTRLPFDPETDSAAAPDAPGHVHAPVGQRGWVYVDGPDAMHIKLPRVGPWRWAVDVHHGACVKIEHASVPTN